MSDKNRDIEKLKQLKHNGVAYINWFQDGGAEVQRVNDVYVVFGVPAYGGYPQFEEVFMVGNEQGVVDLAYSWT